MLLKAIKLRNFRGYRDNIILELDKLTAIVGKNDIGKSTILEALDIFFNNGKGIIKPDKTDVNILSEEDIFEISVVLDRLPNELIVDSTVKTNITQEFLVNDDGFLEIKKYFKGGNLKNTVIVSKYPDVPELIDLHSKKIGELKDIALKVGIDVEDKRKSSLFRNAIFKHFENGKFKTLEIDVAVEGGKQIWTSLEKYLPLFSLFQSDRKNEESDSEIQEPVKFAVAEVLKNSELMDKLDEVYTEVVNATVELTELTLKKLEEMNPEIAKELKPNFKKPTWEKVFSCGLESDQNIPLNKRGSGVRRLVLLNFFRAEAERRKNERGVPNVIYAFEEPETSQHPKHQQMLIESFIELSRSEVNQVIFTTHSPEVAKLLPTSSLRLLEKVDGSTIINKPDDSSLEKIADALGVLPSIELQNLSQVKVAICVEGKNDISFLQNLSSYVPELKEICDINSNKCILLPMGGSTLQFWINNKYLSKLNLAQVHIYDSDLGSDKPNKYREYIEKVNTIEKSTGFETSLREMENYITPDILKERMPEFKENIDIAQWKTLNIPELVAKATHEASDSENLWSELTDKKRKDKISKAKNRINDDFAKYINKEVLERYSYFDEVKGWFEAVNKFV